MKLLSKKNVIKYLIIIGLISILIFPIVLSFIFSFLSFDSIQDSSWITGSPIWTTNAYTHVLKTFWLSLGVTTLIVSFKVILSLLITSMTAFAFSRLELPYKNLLWYSMIILVLIPDVSLITYQYEIIVDMNLDEGLIANTFAIVLTSSLNLAALYLLKNAYDSLGKSHKNISKSYSLSNSKYYFICSKEIYKEFVFSGIIIMIGAWNSYVWPNLILAGSGYQTLSMWIINVSIDPVDNIMHPEYQMAASIISTIPIILIYYSFNKQFQSIQKKTS